ncbi:MAG: leucyl aminopeptidase [Solirubrobacterales bacterium]
MHVDVIAGAVEADLDVVGLPDGEELPAELASLAGASDVKTAFKKTTLLRPSASERVLIVGLGDREKLNPERLRVAAAVALRGAQSVEAASIAWILPEASARVALAAAAGAIVEGTILASYRFDRFRTSDDEPKPGAVDRLALVAPEGVEVDPLKTEVRFARAGAMGANRARELQDLPANILNPTYLADRARQISVAFEPVSAEVIDRAGAEELGMGGLVAVAKGTAEEPALIVLRYSGGADGVAPVGLVGKAVTFDSGGISIKPSAKMEEMKFDMSGGAAVLEAVAAIAELGLPINVVAAIPSTENMPSGTATRPGDIITQLNGKTVEVNNTDAEGRLILADALTYCVRELGADRVVDLATLTGAVLIALGSTYAALVSNDDAWAEQVGAAAERTGELAWRLPLHEEFKELTKGKVADLTNASAKRKAGTIYAASFLEEFVDSKPWVHLDIAGTAWDVGREYVGNGATGYGVRLLVSLARELAG